MMDEKVLERLANKLEKASKQCPTGMSIDSLRFKRFIKAIVNYEDMEGKIIEENYPNRRIGAVSPIYFIKLRVRESLDKYNSMQIQDARMRLTI